jgi:D-alanine-D-alanine ligase and related ATP-grasp enzymes
MDKVASKKLMDLHGIPNAKYLVINQPSDEIPAGLRLPLIVKPANEGSTFGLTLVESADDWKKAMDLVFRYGNEALVEEFFEGVETTAAILDGRPLPVVEIRPPGKIYDYDAKYTHKQGETLYLCPPKSIPEELQKKIQETALKFYEVSGAEEILRVDVLASLKDGSICVLEGNSIPGCTSSSLVPKAAKTAGIPFPEFCSMMVSAATKR